MDEFSDACKIAIAQMYPDALRLVAKGMPAQFAPRCKCGRAVRGACAACEERQKAKRRK